jgi:iron complex transport system permease protein
MKEKSFFKLSIMFILIILLSITLIFYGESGFSANFEMLKTLRVPKMLCAIVAGSILSMSGLVMQTYFQNPLAGPDILGISSGASLFVAFGIYFSSVAKFKNLATLGLGPLAFMGALLTFLLMILFSKRSRLSSGLLIAGILISYFSQALISILINFSRADDVKAFLIWGQGTFRNVQWEELPLFIILYLIFFIPSILMIKKWNQLILGEEYAFTMGLSSFQIKLLVLLFNSLWISFVTIYCGPIGFIGIVSSHMANSLFQFKSFQLHFIGTILCGISFALLAEILITFFSEAGLSANIVLGLIGIPFLFIPMLFKTEVLL